MEVQKGLFSRVRAKLGAAIFFIGAVWEGSKWFLDNLGRLQMLRDLLPSALEFVSRPPVGIFIIIVGLGLIVWAYYDIKYRHVSEPSIQRRPIVSLLIFTVTGAIVGGIGGASIWALTRPTPSQIASVSPAKPTEPVAKTPIEHVKHKPTPAARPPRVPQYRPGAARPFLEFGGKGPELAQWGHALHNQIHTTYMKYLKLKMLDTTLDRIHWGEYQNGLQTEIMSCCFRQARDYSDESGFGHTKEDRSTEKSMTHISQWKREVRT